MSKTSAVSCRVVDRDHRVLSRAGTALLAAAAILVLPTCRIPPEAVSGGALPCDAANGGAGDYIGVTDLAIVPPTPQAGAAFEFRWTSAMLNFQIESGLMGLQFELGNATTRITLEGDPAVLQEIHEEPFDYAHPQPFAGGQHHLKDESVGIEVVLPTFAEDLAPGTYTATIELVGDDICGAGEIGTSDSVDFEIFPEPECAVAGVERLDLAISELSFDPPPAGVISWTVDYLVELPGGGPNPGPSVTLQEVLTVTDSVTGDVLFSETRTGPPGEMMPGDSLARSWLSADITLANPPTSGEVIVRMEIGTVEGGSECGTGDLATNNAQEITVMLPQ